MTNLLHEISDGEYVRLFRTLSAANKAAESLQLSTVVHLTNMALLQLSLDWEGVRAEDERAAKLNAVFQSKKKLAFEDEALRTPDCV